MSKITPSQEKVIALCDQLQRIAKGQAQWKILGMLNQYRAKCFEISKYAMGLKSKETLLENERQQLIVALQLQLERCERGLDA